MDAMILAAGMGSRLQAVTGDTPKALVEVGGVTMLERVARRLIDAGADRLIINISHHANQIESFVQQRDGFGVEVLLSREEPAPLETGGGLKHAASLFRRNAPFFLHNADVICNLDLRDMYGTHNATRALATLAVNHRKATRYLLFDGTGLCGRYDTRRGHGAEVHTDCESITQLAFAGVHVISPAFLDMMTETGTFSIIDTYLRLAGRGEAIISYDIGAAMWMDIGTPERLEAARAWAETAAMSRKPA
jgi:NDP-sugar pyrophosphorylase family protein